MEGQERSGKVYCNRCILDCRFIFSGICKVINGSTVPAQAKMIYFITLLDKGMLLYTTQISNHEHRGNFCRKNLYWATNVVVGYLQCTELSANCIHKQISSGSWLCSHFYTQVLKVRYESDLISDIYFQITRLFKLHLNETKRPRHLTSLAFHFNSCSKL